MPKLFAALVVLSLFFLHQTVWAQLSSSQEQRLKDLEVKEKAWKVWEESKNSQEEGLREPEAKIRPFKSRQTEKGDYNAPFTEGNSGRFQAVRLDSNAVFILDTKEGHLWVWVIQKDNRGQPAEFIFYQGRVVPGAHMGELIDRTNKKEHGVFPSKP